MSLQKNEISEKCPQCPMAGFCAGASSDPDVPDSARYKAVMLLLMAPLVLMLAALVAVLSLSGSSLMAACSSLAVLSLYFLSFYIYSKITERKINCPKRA